MTEAQEQEPKISPIVLEAFKKAKHPPQYYIDKAYEEIISQELKLCYRQLKNKNKD